MKYNRQQLSLMEGSIDKLDRYSDRNICGKLPVNETVETPSLYNVSQSVSQGRVLSALLFLVSIDVLLNEIFEINRGFLSDCMHFPSNYGVSR
jgi:hypothetical protein